ncbi:MAG: signal peptidase I [Bacteroidota bacterium]|nr:signal peptidase I [Candidatus Kapabacteria bacterium]MCS7301970.1 signal peptidase I [Candidatus Kapabacteria bacterium]MCX7936574.1 signal peptidase I [Chlorobiota bacterium]MDW8074767.1 signal peptidase I [Bacteroidota bacterium]MDW8271406.1 signal peptidase I [Bacteroidota bacterium]
MSTTPIEYGVTLRRSLAFQIIGVFIAAVVIATTLRAVVVGVYVIPSRSMEPTLLAGDVVLVSKVSYWLGVPPTIPLTDIVLSRRFRLQWSKPQRGDVVVFRFAYQALFPHEPEYFVKRIVAVAGDTVWVISDSVLSRKPPKARIPPEQHYGGMVIVPHRGMRVRVLPTTIDYWRPFIEREGNRVRIERSSVLINDSVCSHYVFQQDYYYVLGDNRSSSFDSRYWGFVSESDIIGKPVVILWSKSPILGTIRWERIGAIPR